MSGGPRRQASVVAKPLDTSLVFRAALPALGVDSVLTFRLQSGAVFERIADHLRTLLQDLVADLPDDLVELDSEANDETFAALREKACKQMAEWQLRLAQAEASNARAEKAKIEMARMREGYLKELQGLRQQLQKKQRAEEKGEDFQPDLISHFNPAAYVAVDEDTKLLLKQQSDHLEEQHRTRVGQLRESMRELQEKLNARTMHAKLQDEFIGKKAEEAAAKASAKPTAAVQTEPAWDAIVAEASSSATKASPNAADGLVEQDSEREEPKQVTAAHGSRRKTTHFARRGSKSSSGARRWSTSVVSEFGAEDQGMDGMDVQRGRRGSEVLQAPDLPSAPTLEIEVQTELDCSLLQKAEELLAKRTENAWLVLMDKNVGSGEEEDNVSGGHTQNHSGKDGKQASTVTEPISPSSPTPSPKSVVPARKSFSRATVHAFPRSKSESIGTQVDSAMIEEEQQEVLRAAVSQPLGSSCSAVDQLLSKHGVGTGGRPQSGVHRHSVEVPSAPAKLKPLQGRRPVPGRHSSGSMQSFKESSGASSNEGLVHHSADSLIVPDEPLSDTDSESDKESVNSCDEEAARVNTRAEPQINTRPELNYQESKLRAKTEGDLALMDDSPRKPGSSFHGKAKLLDKGATQPLKSSDGARTAREALPELHVVQVGQDLGCERPASRPASRTRKGSFLNGRPRSSSRASSKTAPEMSAAAQPVSPTNWSMANDVGGPMRISSASHRTSLVSADSKEIRPISPRPPSNPRPQSRS